MKSKFGKFLIAFIFAAFLWNMYVSDAESEGIYYKSSIEEGLYELIDKEKYGWDNVSFTYYLYKKTH